MKRTITLLCSLSMVLACGGDDDMGGSDPTMGGTETDASTGSTSDGPTTTSPTTTTTTTTTDPTTGPTSDPDTGETDPGDETGEDSTETGDETGDAISFADEVWPILQSSCSCHLSAPFPEGLNLSQAVAYDNLVGVSAAQANLDRVEVGSSQNSYLWHKVNNTHVGAGGSGGRMPAGGAAPLSQANIDLIAKWIDDGAEP